MICLILFKTVHLFQHVHCEIRIVQWRTTTQVVPLSHSLKSSCGFARSTSSAESRALKHRRTQMAQRGDVRTLARGHADLWCYTSTFHTSPCRRLVRGIDSAGIPRCALSTATSHCKRQGMGPVDLSPEASANFLSGSFSSTSASRLQVVCASFPRSFQLPRTLQIRMDVLMPHKISTLIQGERHNVRRCASEVWHL